MRTIVIVLLLVLSPLVSHAGSCDAFKKIENAGLYNNERFWDDFAKLSSKGQPSDAQINALIGRYGSSTASASASATVPTATASASAVGRSPVQLHRQAEKSLKKAPVQIRNKFEEFVRTVREKGVNGAIQEFRQKGWNYEFLKQEGFYSVRLNQGYRAAFDIKDNQIIVRDIGQHIYAH